jgi:ribosomal protein S18 acetylase RimI-like enzyme
VPTWDDRFPFLSSAGKKQMQKRLEACYPSISKSLGLSMEQLQSAKPLGCGNFGCTMLVDGLPSEKSVLKATSDNLEAHVVQLLTEWGEDKPKGIVNYEGIWQLGDCSVLPKMRPFEFADEAARKEARKYYPERKPQKHTYRGPGGPYRPVWLIQREELPDVNSHFKGRIKLLQAFLFEVYRWAKNRAIDLGAPGASMVRSGFTMDWDAIVKKADAFSGFALIEALDWLMERQIGYYDFQKLANLGWRDGTGLVIRDIGFASTEMQSEKDPAALNGFAGEFSGSVTKTFPKKCTMCGRVYTRADWDKLPLIGRSGDEDYLIEMRNCTNTKCGTTLAAEVDQRSGRTFDGFAGLRDVKVEYRASTTKSASNTSVEVEAKVGSNQAGYAVGYVADAPMLAQVIRGDGYVELPKMLEEMTDKVAYFDQVNVDPKYRGGVIGVQLTQRLLTALHRLGANAVFLHAIPMGTRASRTNTLVDYYSSLGFRVVKNYSDGGTIMVMEFGSKSFEGLRGDVVQFPPTDLRADGEFAGSSGTVSEHLLEDIFAGKKVKYPHVEWKLWNWLHDAQATGSKKDAAAAVAQIIEGFFEYLELEQSEAQEAFIQRLISGDLEVEVEMSESPANNLDSNVSQRLSVRIQR